MVFRHLFLGLSLLVLLSAPLGAPAAQDRAATDGEQALRTQQAVQAERIRQLEGAIDALRQENQRAIDAIRTDADQRIGDVDANVTNWMAILAIIATVLGLGIGAGSYVGATSKAEQQVKEWVKENGQKILEEQVKTAIARIEKQADEAIARIGAKEAEVDQHVEGMRKNKEKSDQLLSGLSANAKTDSAKTIAPDDREKVTRDARIARNTPQDQRGFLDWVTIGMDSYWSGRWQEAVDAFDRAANAKDAQPEQLAGVLVNKGAALASQGLNKEAIETYDDVVKRFGESAEPAVLGHVAIALNNKGITLGAQEGRDVDAIEAYDEVIKQFGESSESALLEQVAMALVNKGVMLIKLGRNNEAIEVYNDVDRRFCGRSEPELLARVAWALFLKGGALGALGQNEEEIAAYDEVVKRFRKNEEPLLQEPVSWARHNGSVLRARQSPNA